MLKLAEFFVMIPIQLVEWVIIPSKSTLIFKTFHGYYMPITK